MTRLSARLLALTLAAGILLVPSLAQAKPTAPKITAPKVNATVSTMPALTWNKAKGATSYELQISSDSGFNPAVVTATTGNLRFVQHEDAAERRLLLARALPGRGERVLEVVEGAQVHEEVERDGRHLDAGRPHGDRVPEPDDPELGARAGRRDLQGRRGERRLGWRRRRAGWSHLERRARVERRRQADRDGQHEPRRLQGAEPGHVLLAGHPGRRAGLQRHAVGDLLVRLDLGGHDDPDTSPTWCRASRSTTRCSPGRPIPGAAGYEIEINPTSGFAPGSRRSGVHHGDVVRAR